MRKAIAGLCLGALLMGGATAAVAHNTSSPTTVHVRGTDDGPGTFRIYGDLQASPKCRANRKVKIFFDYQPIQRMRGIKATQWVLVDVDRSSRNGMWAGSGDENENVGAVDKMKIRAIEKNVGPSGHRHICQADTAVEGRVPTP